MDKEKQKDKIRKLLELSLSDNEHEAATALRQAMSLMNKHNLNREEVYGQQMTEHKIETPYYRIPDWYLSLASFMAKTSGCFLIYRNSRSDEASKAVITLAGRERDVENTLYLITFLERSLESRVRAYKKKLQSQEVAYISSWVKSYRYGFITKIYGRIEESRKQFFSAENSTGLVCIDCEVREQDARRFYVETHNSKIRTTSSQSQYYSAALMAGQKDAEDLQLNSALNGQDEIRGISHKRGGS